MYIYENALEENKNFVIWGCGRYLRGVVDKISPDINITHIIDSDKHKWGRITATYSGKELKCQSPDILPGLKNTVVMVAVQSTELYKSIKNDIRKIWDGEVIHINEAVKSYLPEYEKKQIALYDNAMGSVEEPGDMDKIICYADISVPVETCNLQCQYCYVGQNNDLYEREVVYHSPQFVRRAFSRKRIGGTAFINLCGMGETLLCKELPGIIRELLYEGHYIEIVTNTLISKSIKQILDFNMNDRIIFKCSFHYAELKRRNLLEKYVENIQMIKDHGASLTIELVPHDELIPYIDEIKSFSMENFGALPHVSVSRDETKKNIPLFSKLSEEEFENTWGVFDSSMFDYKMKTLKKQTEYCIAGRGSFIMNLDNGEAVFCCKNDRFTNIYKNIDKPIEYQEIGYRCKSPWCINAHAYLTLGMIDKVNDYTYLEMRDRMCTDGSHWIQERMAGMMRQRICDNLKSHKDLL